MQNPYQTLLEAIEEELEDSAPTIAAIVHECNKDGIYMEFPLTTLIIYPDGTWKIG